MAIGFKEDPVSDLTSVSEEDFDELDEEEQDGQRSVWKKQMTMFAIAFIVVAVITVGTLIMPKDTTETADGTEVSETTVVTNSFEVGGNTQEADATESATMALGITDFDKSENNTTSDTISPASDFLLDLSGVEIPQNFAVADRTYVKDFVNYTAKRAVVDDGMELYWLEVTYKGKNYRMQVPFYAFKDLDKSGICAVEMEVLTLEGGGQVISYMQIVTDYSNLE